MILTENQVMWQVGLLIAFTITFIYTVYIMWRYPLLRPVSFAVACIAASHAVFYSFFVIWPDALDAGGMSNFSIVLRYQVAVSLFSGFAAFVHRRGRYFHER